MCKFSYPRACPILGELEYPLLALIRLTAKTVFLSKVAPLGANRNWPWHTRSRFIVLWYVERISCGMQNQFNATSPLNYCRANPAPPSFPIERTPLSALI